MTLKYEFTKNYVVILEFLKLKKKSFYIII